MDVVRTGCCQDGSSPVSAASKLQKVEPVAGLRQAHQRSGTHGCRIRPMQRFKLVVLQRVGSSLSGYLLIILCKI